MTRPINNQNTSRLKRAVCALDRFMNAFTNCLAAFGMMTLIAAIMVVVVDIVWRRIFHHAFIGTVDVTQFCVMAAASWSIPHAFSTGAHVSVDLLGKIAKNGFALAMEGAARLIATLLMAFLFSLSWQRAMEQWSYGDVSQNLSIPMIAFWLFLLSGMVLSAVVCFVKFLKLVFTKETT
ncbi:MAG: TRAP transporter small permease [Hyphomicrobiales bacterium]